MARLRLDALRREHFKKSYATIATNRTDISDALAGLGVRPVGTEGPFLWYTPDSGSTRILDTLKDRNIVIATGEPFGASRTAFRINLMIDRVKAHNLVKRFNR